jgi:hypothetical protein
MAEKVFYSWQSDLPSSTNRGFIQSALEKATKELRSDDSLTIEPVIDRDTLGLSGSPDITESIFNKIDLADIFIADVSLINQGSEKPTPNPNVLIELGYAIKVLGWHKIIMMMNSHYGDPNKLPFDLKSKRVLTFSIEEKSTQKAPQRNILTKFLIGAISLVLENKVENKETNSDLNSEAKKIDKALLKQFLEVLPSNGSIRFIDENNMAGFSFELKALDDLDKFRYEWNDAEHEFLDTKLEVLKKELHELVCQYLKIIAIETFPTSSRGYNTVPPEWKIEQPDRFFEVVNKLHSLAGEIVSKHQELIRIGRKILYT